MDKKTALTLIIQNYKVIEKYSGIFIFGSDVYSGALMKKLGYALDFRKINKQTVRGFWVEKIYLNPENEIFQAKYQKRLLLINENKELKQRIKKPSVSIRPGKIRSNIYVPHKKIKIDRLQEIEIEILKEITPADFFRGILVTADDINNFFIKLDIGPIQMGKVISGLGFLKYSNKNINGYWIRPNHNFIDRIRIPKNYMIDRILEMNEYKPGQEHILCPNCRGLCTREFKCLTCYGFMVIKKPL